MKLIDVHAHMDYPPLDQDTGAIIQKAIDADIKVIISNGTDPASNRRVLALAEKYDIIKPALGFYPTHVVEESTETLDTELDFIRQSKPVAIGEVGLDGKYGFDSDSLMSDLSLEDQDKVRQKQEDGFIKIIKLANDLNIPLIVHSRKAELRTIELLEEHNAKKVVMHCFMGKKKLIPRIIKNGWSFSISYLLMKLEQVQFIVKETPLAQLLTETDAPYLGPQPGRTNDPSTISLFIEKMAELKGLTKEELSEQIFFNYLKLFA